MKLPPYLFAEVLRSRKNSTHFIITFKNGIEAEIPLRAGMEMYDEEDGTHTVGATFEQGIEKGDKFLFDNMFPCGTPVRTYQLRERRCLGCFDAKPPWIRQKQKRRRP